MRGIFTTFKIVATTLILCSACSSDPQSHQPDNSTDISTSPSYFKFEGDMLIRPTDYRSWVYVGTPLTPNDMNNGKAAFPEFHNVYIDPISYKYWKETGTWRDGTILVKELVSVGTKAAVSGNGYFMGDFIGLEATIKSSKYSPDEPGNWSYYSFTNPEGGNLKDQTKAFATKDCNACHQASAAEDFVFTQHYPTLTAAKGVGENMIPENSAMRMQAVKNEEASIWAPTAETPLDEDFGIPLDKAGLFEYLVAGEYKSFKTKESKLHPSLGPHTKLGLPVRIYMNDIIAASLEEGNDEHPKGAIIVKEMFDKQDQLQGWAVMVKTNANTEEDGKGWFWYEVTSPTDQNSIAAMGNGVIGCYACHKVGNDMVRISFPLQ